MFTRLLYLAFRLYVFIVRPVTVGVRVMLVRDGQVLLVRHTYVGGWYLPGGGLKRGETVEDAARREVREETGAVLGEVSLLGIYSYFEEFKNDHNAVFLCRDFQLGSHHDHEIAEVKFFPMESLPGETHPSHRRRIEEFASGRAVSAFGRW
ncbi:MAG: NUDIX domain-containing protein [Chloroflexota bacterium]